MKEKRKRFIQIFALALIMLLIASASYAYFAARVNEASSTDITVTTSTVDNLTFETGESISISATQSNFTESSGNQSGSTYASATLVANNDTNDATAYYSIYLNIPTNEFEYTTSDSIAELLLVIIDKDGNIITELEDLEYVTITDGEGNTISGFDITGYIGSLAVTEFQEIVSDGSVTDTWNFSVTLVNLDSDQSTNAGKSLNAYLTIMKSGNTLQAYSSGSEIWAYKSSITKIIFDDTGTTISDYEEVFDLSEADNNTIKAYLVSNDSSSLSMLSNSLIENKVNYLSNEIAEANTYTVYIVSSLPILGNEDMSYWFYRFTSLESIEGLDKLITSNVINMYCLFAFASQITSLDLSNFDTSNVTNMSYMFWQLLSLTELDVSSFNTSRVETMEGMFGVSVADEYYSNLERIIFGDEWKTSNVTNMQEMFKALNNLKSLNLDNFDTTNVTTMYEMFRGCSSLTALDLSMFDTTNVTTMYEMFRGCSSLTALDLSMFDTTNVTDIAYMFYRCNSLISLDLSTWDTSNVTTMYAIFGFCEDLASLELSNFDTSSVTDMSYMFWNCLSLTYLDVSCFSTSNVTSMEGMFGVSRADEYYSNLERIIFGDGWDTSNVTNMQEMFKRLNSLISIDLSDFDTSQVTTMYEMFYDCNALTSLDLSNASFTAVTSYYDMFYNNSNSITITVKDSDAYDFITARLSNGGTVVIA